MVEAPLSNKIIKKFAILRNKRLLSFLKGERYYAKTICYIILLGGCSTIAVPPTYVYKEIKTEEFKLASYQKITSPSGVYKIYIEGDGYAFNAHKRATQDPTPVGTLMLEIAFNNKSPNVIYLARPCQYVKSRICSKRHWTTARFAPEVINTEYEAVREIADENPVQHGAKYRVSPIPELRVLTVV